MIEKALVIRIEELAKEIEQLNKINIDLCDSLNATEDARLRRSVEIVTLQQEVERLKDENIGIKKWNACEAEQFEQLLESDKRRIELEAENEQLQSQNKLLREALNCLKKFDGTHISGAVCDACSNSSVNCDECVFDEALREG